MSDDNARTNAKGFAKGKSGNPRGRPPLSKKISHPENYRDRVFAIADFKIPTSLGGKRRKLSLYEVNILNLALKGAEGDQRASEKFLDQVDQSLQKELRFMKEELARIEAVEPAWIEESDPERRDALKRQWDYAVAAARGRRERTAPHFPPPKRRRRD